jgi:hypothetical protein
MTQTLHSQNYCNPLEGRIDQGLTGVARSTAFHARCPSHVRHPGWLKKSESEVPGLKPGPGVQRVVWPAQWDSYGWQRHNLELPLSPCQAPHLGFLQAVPPCGL